MGISGRLDATKTEESGEGGLPREGFQREVLGLRQNREVYVRVWNTHETISVPAKMSTLQRAGFFFHEDGVYHSVLSITNMMWKVPKHGVCYNT